MELYVSQLLEDINEAVLRQLREEAEQNEPSAIDEKFLQTLEASLEDPDYTMGSKLGFERIQFPPSERLSPEQLKKLTIAIKDLWRAFHYQPDLPDTLPNEIAYRLLLEKFDECHPYLPMGTWHVEFCDYDYEKCPLGLQYCTCKKS